MRIRPALATLACALPLLVASRSALAAPALAPEKRALDNNGAPLERGDLLVYVATIPNVGADPATSVAFHDVLPAGFETVTVVSIPPGARDESDLGAPAPFVRVTGFDIAAGDTATIVISGFVGASAPGPTLCNQGEVSSAEITVPVPTDDPATATPGDPTCLAIDGAVVLLSARKKLVDANGAPVAPGDTLLYTIDVDNTGSADATLAFVRDPIATAFASVLVIATPPGSIDRSVLTGPAPEIRIEDFAIPAGARATVVFSATLGAAATGTACNQAFAGSAEVTVPVGSDDPDTATPGDPTCARLPGVPGLELELEVRDPDGAGIATGDRLLFLLEARNPGTAPVSGLAVEVPLERGLKNLRTVRLPPGAIEASVPSGPTLLFRATDATLAPGASLLYVFEAEVAPSAASPLCHAGSATSVEIAGPVVSDDRATLEPGDPTCVLLGPAPRLVTSTLVATDGNAAPWAPGDIVTWTLTIANTGSGDATGIAARQDIPTGIDGPSVGSIPAGATDRSDLSGPSPYLLIDGFTLAPGATATVVWTGTIAPTPDGTRLCGQGVLASAERSGSFATDDPATAAVADPTCLVVGPALATSTKDLIDLDRGALEPGDLVVWAFEARNTGSGAALDVRLADELPAGVGNLAVIALPPGAVDGSDLLATPPRLDVGGFTIAAGASERVLVSGEVDAVPPGPEICNQATLSSATLTVPLPTDDPTTIAVADATCIAFGLRPELLVTKEVVSITGTVPAAPGDLLLWLVRIENRGSGPARAVHLVDALADLESPELVSLPLGALDLSQPGATPPLVAVEIPRIEAGSTALVAILSRVVATPTAAEVCNRAVVSAREIAGPLASDDPATAAAGDATCLVVTPQPGVPEVTSILPCRGTKKGGTEVTITGTGFEPGLTVTFDGLAATVVSVSATAIVVLTPPHPPVGPVDVVVTNPDGLRDTVSGGYVYTPPPFPIALSGKKAASDAYLIWTGGTGPNVVLRSNDPNFGCGTTDAFVSDTGTIQVPGRGKNRTVTYFRVE